MKRLLNKASLIISLLLIVFCLFACEEKDPPITEIDTRYTDELRLQNSFEGKDFLKDGIGEVTLQQNVDGDTAHFKTKSGKTFTARFLMINTPESTAYINPWGKAASKYVAGILSSATQIVCESEDLTLPAQLDTTNKRYLAYVWYRIGDGDFRLLNLEIIEQCYSRFTDTKNNCKYGEYFEKAQEKSHQLGKRVHGEKDPDYNYSAMATEVTIAYLRHNFQKFANGSKLKIRARIVRIVGDNIYLEDVEQNYNPETGDYEVAGIYLFSGYGSGLGSAKIGNIINMICKCTENEIYGNQLTEPSKITYDLPEGDYLLREYDGKQTIDLASLEGLVIKVKNFTITYVTKPNEEGAYTITGKTLSNQEIRVRIDGACYPKLAQSTVEIGKTYNVIGGVSQYKSDYYDGDFQIMLGNFREDCVNDFVLVD